jgi:hypothetical protein
MREEEVAKRLLGKGYSKKLVNFKFEKSLQYIKLMSVILNCEKVL